MDLGVLREILADCIKAPSGENCQPWLFDINGELLNIYNVPDRDNSLYSWGQRASLLSHGALLETLEISSEMHGYAVSIEILPETNEPNLVAQVSFSKKDHGNKDQLFEAIHLRVTNRRSYSLESLNSHEIAELLGAASKFGSCRLLFADDRGRKETLSRASSMNEVVLLENKMMHNFFFSHVNWTKKEDIEKSVGFYIKTLEFKPQQLSAFKLFKNWKVLRLFNLMGVPRFVARENAKIYKSCGAIGAIVINESSQENFITAGRLLQRVWLRATNLGLALQPLTGILFLFLAISSGGKHGLSQRHVELVKDSYGEIKSAFNVEEGVIAFVFRIGHAQGPSARSSRLPLNSFFRTSTK